MREVDQPLLLSTDPALPEQRDSDAVAGPRLGPGRRPAGAGAQRLSGRRAPLRIVRARVHGRLEELDPAVPGELGQGNRIHVAAEFAHDRDQVQRSHSGNDLVALDAIRLQIVLQLIEAARAEPDGRKIQ